MVRIADEQVNHLEGIVLKVDNYTPPSAGAGFSEAALTTAINAVLTPIEDGLGSNLADTFAGNDSTPGLACPLEKLCEVRDNASQDPRNDDVTNSEIHCLISRKYTSHSFVTVTGIDIDFVSQASPADAINNYISFDNTTGEISYSSDGGSTYGAAVDISTAAVNDVFKLNDNGSTSYVVIRVNGAALPVAIVDEVFTVADDNYALGFFSWSAGAYIPVFNNNLAAIDFGIPVICRWEAKKPSYNLDIMSGKFLDVVSAGAEKYYVEKLTPSALNTIPDLAYEPSVPARTSLEVNGVDLVYGAGDGFTIATKAVTVYPSNLGYNIQTSFDVVAKYFRV